MTLYKTGESEKEGVSSISFMTLSRTLHTSCDFTFCYFLYFYQNSCKWNYLKKNVFHMLTEKSAMFYIYSVCFFAFNTFKLIFRKISVYKQFTSNSTNFPHSFFKFYFISVLVSSTKCNGIIGSMRQVFENRYFNLSIILFSRGIKIETFICPSG